MFQTANYSSCNIFIVVFMQKSETTMRKFFLGIFYLEFHCNHDPNAPFNLAVPYADSTCVLFLVWLQLFQKFASTSTEIIHVLPSICQSFHLATFIFKFWVKSLMLVLQQGNLPLPFLQPLSCWKGIGYRLLPLYELQCMYVKVPCRAYLPRKMFRVKLPHLPWWYLHIELSSEGPTLWTFDAFNLLSGICFIVTQSRLVHLLDFLWTFRLFH